jgi:hypothetical protein
MAWSVGGRLDNRAIADRLDSFATLLDLVGLGRFLGLSTRR